MKLGNFITLLFFTGFAIYMIIAGYPKESSQSLFGGLIFLICLCYWTTYFNRYTLFKKEITYLQVNNSQLAHKLHISESAQTLSKEINKLNSEKIKVIEELAVLNTEIISNVKSGIISRDKVIKAQEKIIKELTAANKQNKILFSK